MSDFLGAGWSTYIALVTLVGIFWCIWLLFSVRKVKAILRPDGEVADTGHVWDGELLKRPGILYFSSAHSGIIE